jgi:hypothetical protein
MVATIDYDVYVRKRRMKGELSMRKELTDLRGILTRAVAMVDELLRSQPGESKTNTDAYRQFPGGPLTPAGVAEIERRFDAGQPDSEIALAMEISLGGVSRRRGLWRRSRAR